MGRSSWVTDSQRLILTSHLPTYVAIRDKGQAGIKNPARERLFNKILEDIVQDDPDYLSKQDFNSIGYGGTLGQREKAFISVTETTRILMTLLTSFS